MAKWIAVAVAVLAIGAGMAWWFLLRASPDVRAAKALVDAKLKSPSQAKYISIDTVSSSEDWRVVHVIVDAPNGFGAMMRESYCVTFQHEAGGKWRYYADTAVLPCDRSPQPEEIGRIAKANNFGEVGKP
jgi:hypothetical protein